MCDVASASALAAEPLRQPAQAAPQKAGRVVVPDFLSTAAPLLAAHDADGDDPVQRIRDAALGLADQGTGMWLAAAIAAEENLAGWTGEKPFGRPPA